MDLEEAVRDVERLKKEAGSRLVRAQRLLNALTAQTEKLNHCLRLNGSSTQQ